MITFGLVLVTATLFGRVVTHEFINYDDPAYVVANHHVQGGLTAENIRWALTTLAVGNWHPLTWLSLELDASFFGPNPGGYHATNLALHVANCVLLFWAFSYMTGALVRSASVALLFAIHPLHVESVAWVAERKDLLCAFFGMLSLLFYACYAQRPSAMRYLAATICLALGLSAKSMLVTLPCVLLLLDYWPLKRFESGGIARLILEKLPLLALSAACGILTIAAQRQGGAVSSTEHVPLSFRLMNASDAYLAYLYKAVCPLDLAVFYPHPMNKQVPALAVVAAALLLAATCWICSRWRRQPFLAVGWFWFLGMLVPVIGLVQVGAQAIADRYTYMPLIGLFVAATWWFGELVQKQRVSRRLAGALGAAVFVSFGACTWNQLRYWQDDVALWRHALEVTGPNDQAYEGLGEALLRRGLAEQALPYLSDLAHRMPDYAGGHVNLGAALLSLGRLEESRTQLAAAVRINPRHATARYNLALVSNALGDLEEATAQWAETLRVDPYYWKAHLALASSLIQQGAQEEADRHIHAAERIDRDAVRNFMTTRRSSFRVGLKDEQP